VTGLQHGLVHRDRYLRALPTGVDERKKISTSTLPAGQIHWPKEIEDSIWLVSFMHYDLGYIDLEQKTLQPIDNPFGTRLSPIS
jgi:hypothetical protein